MVDRRRFHILIIEENKELNDKICNRFKNLEYRSIQAFSSKEALKYFEEYKSRLKIVVLSIDMNGIKSNEFIDQIEKNSQAKIILLSLKENYKKREEFFAQGIFDYYLKSNPSDHIVDDIDKSIFQLEDNKNETILLVEGSKDIRLKVQFILEKRNYKVIAVSNATDGLMTIRDNDISLLILDLELPDMHGIAILETLRDLYYINKFPILVLSASNNPSIVRQALKKGSSDLIKKPFLYEEFLLKIDQWIKSAKWQRTIKQQKQQIQNNFSTLSALIDSTPDALFIFEDDICIQVNEQAIDLFKTTKENILQKNITVIFSQLDTTNMEKILDKTHDCTFEAILQNTDNENINVQIKEKNIQQYERTIKIVVVVDITQVKQNEKMLSHQTKMASMGEMIGNIAHQWRQPLTAISVAAGGIKLNFELDMEDRQETIKELDNIVSNTQFLSSTIEDFQNFLKDNKTMMHFSFNDTLDKTITIISANLDSYEIKIVKLYTEHIQIYGIQNDFIQVLLNIINNAADVLKTPKFDNQKKYIFIDITQDEKNITISIKDNAGGIPQKVLPKIFDPYFTTKHQAQGTGLGLYMTHQIIVDSLKGYITAQNETYTYENNSYHGANFIITLPK